ncbi:MAG: hypothetical protein J6V01_02595 [Clostridia bacterium]|nr:hypothetical protein [Clostridia bacterium]
MKKTVSILLTAALLVSLLLALPIASSAKEEASDPVAISDAAGFAAMETGGSYYLTKDITISETHSAAFSGTFDGKGFKITTSVPLFDTFEGTAKDLVIEGSITSSADRCGAFCNTVTGESTFTNITNKANIAGSDSKVTSADDLGVVGSYGGIIGTTLKNIPLTVENCSNYGKITGYDAGGLMGKSHAKLTMKNCKNFGDVSGADCGGGVVSWLWGDFTLENCENGSKTVIPDITSAGDAPGGMVSYISENTNGTFKNCVNYGHIHSESKDAAGIMGRSGAKGTHNYDGCVNYGPVEGDWAGGITGNEGKNGIHNYTGCINYGSIEGTKTGGIVGVDQGAITALRCMNYADIKAQKQAAGIIGAFGASGGDQMESTVTYCGNEGKIVAAQDTAGGIVAYANASSVSKLTIKGCYNNGDVTGGCESSGILGYYNGGADSSCNACFNTGLITTTDTGEKPLALFYNKGSGAKAELSKDNFYLGGCAQNESRFGDNYLEMNPTAGDKFAYGEVCYKLNQALGEEVFFQTIGTDQYPSFDATHKRVVLEGQNYVNPAAQQNPTTGDGVYVMVAVAVISLLGAGYVAVRRVKE